MMDSDLATLYGVTTKRLNEQVKRNKDRLPEDFVFQLSKKEWVSLRSQNATLKQGRHRKYCPYAHSRNCGECLLLLKGLLARSTILRTSMTRSSELCLTRSEH